VTGVKVADASAPAALLFGEPEADSIADRLKGARIAAPALLLFELGNVCLMKIRRHPAQRAALRDAFRLVDDAFRLVDRLGVETVVVEHNAVLDLADSTGLTAYDASCLWLAHTLGAELVTLDRKLLAAST